MTPSSLIGQSEILHRIPSEALAAVTIIAVIGALILAITIIGCITTTIQRVVAIRESNRLILELLNQGYSADEIERVVYGNLKFGKKVGRLFRDARNVFRPSAERHGQMPVPPVKSA